MAKRSTVHRYGAQRFGLRPAALCTSARVARTWAGAVAVLLVLASANGLAAGKPAIVMPPSVQALSPSEVEFALRVDDAESAPAASVVLISGLPADVTFSAGRAVVRGTWEVPLAAIAGLKVKVPTDVKGRSDLVILLTHNSEKYTVVLASARSALIVDAAPGAAEHAAAAGQIVDARKPAEPRKAEEERQTIEAKRAEEVRLAEQAKKAEEARKTEEEQRRIAEAKRLEEARLAEKTKAEQERKVAEAKKAEAARKAEQEQRRVAEGKRAEEARLAEEAKKAEEARKAAAARQAEEEQRRIAEAKRAEEARLAQEPLRVTEASKVADERGAAGQRSAEVSIAALDQRTPLKEPAPSLSQDRLEHLVTQGDRHLVDGNVVVARQYYLRAAQAGMARAALRLAETYDPNELRRLNVQGLMPNIAEAKRWYERAVDLGDTGAQVKLGRLNDK